MQALSLWQPWASLWVGGGKLYETRAWSTNYRGWLLVHAAKKEPVREAATAELWSLVDDAFGANARALPRGAVLGAVRVDHCQPCDQVLRDFLRRELPTSLVTGDFADGRYAIRRAEAVRFEKPIPFQGRQRFFVVPDSALPADFLEHIR